MKGAKGVPPHPSSKKACLRPSQSSDCHADSDDAEKGTDRVRSCPAEGRDENGSRDPCPKREADEVVEEASLLGCRH